MVLIVEDDDDIRDSLADLLVAEGYEVATAKNGAEGLAVATQVRPWLILLDLRMPDLDGWAFRERQLRDPQLAPIPVVLMSAVQNIRNEAAELGVADYLVKPVALALLLNVVQRHSSF